MGIFDEQALAIICIDMVLQVTTVAYIIAVLNEKFGAEANTKNYVGRLVEIKWTDNSGYKKKKDEFLEVFNKLDVGWLSIARGPRAGAIPEVFSEGSHQFPSVFTVGRKPYVDMT